MNWINYIKNETAKGLRITKITQRFYPNVDKDFLIEFSDGTYFNFLLGNKKDIKKMDNFLFLILMELGHQSKGSLNHPAGCLLNSITNSRQCS